MFDIVFNTKRPYTSLGQIIHARQIDDETTVFADHSRGIDGEIRSNGHSRTEHEFRRFVMQSYDHGEYYSTSRSWQFLMLTPKAEVIARAKP